MTAMMNTRRGRPSKGQRHPFTVKLDIDRARKLVEILEILDVNGIDYLTPLIEAHVDSIDLEVLRNQEALPIAKAS